MKSSKKKTFWKYLIGIGGGSILVCATIGSVVSCSNGTTNPASSTSTNSYQNKNSTTTSSSTSTSNSSTLNNTQTYELMNRYNSATIAYKDSQNALTSKISMVTTNNDVANYSKWLNEPNNIIVSVLGQPEAVINVANDNNSKNIPNINLSLNQNSQIFSDIIKGVNTSSDLKQLNNLITFTTTNGTTNKFNLNNYEGKYVSTQDIGLSNYQLDTFMSSANTIDKISINLDGLFGVTSMTTFWSDLHKSTPSLIITATNDLFWDNTKMSPTPFNFTINLLPLIKFSNQKTTLSLNTKNEYSYKGYNDAEIVNSNYPAWNLVVNNAPITTSEFIYVNQTWYTNVPSNLEGLSITPIYVPSTLKNEGNLSSIPYIYVDDNMYVVGMTTPSAIS